VSEKLTETSVIYEYFAPLTKNNANAFGLVDDAAILPAGNMVVTADTLVAGIHFFADDAAYDIAHKALAVNISDVLAKRAYPQAYMLSLAIPHSSKSKAWLAEFSAGLAHMQEIYGCYLLGGDTVVTTGPLVVSITMFGKPDGDMLLRSGAIAGDRLYVSGTIGDAALGLLLRENYDHWKIAGSDKEYLVDCYLRPMPGLQLVSSLRWAGAGMDISDGLLLDAQRMCAASGVGAEIIADCIPLSKAARSVIDVDHRAIEIIMNGGDDYELLLSVPEEKAAKFEAAACGMLTSIGRVIEGRGVRVIDACGNDLQMSSGGYEHFAQRFANYE
jgi:thiamine-monophosphate kinase